jgi:nucleoside-diphosphate-sugar epimerase
VTTVDSCLRGARVLVTGGTGFIGGHLVARLAAGGAKPAILSRDGRSRPADTDVYTGDLRDGAFVRHAIRDCAPDLIFHLASYKRRSARIEDFLPAVETNVLGSLHLFDAAAGLATLKGIVVMGTAEEYGRNPTPYGESMREFPVSAYSYSKQSLTHLCEVLHHLHGLPAVVLRPSIAYGPGQSADMFLPALIQSLLREAPFPMTAGEQTRDFVFVTDVVDAALRAALRPDLAGEVFNIGSGAAITIADLARRVAALAGRPELLQIGSLPYRPGEVMSYSVDIAKARTMLGWRPQVELEEGLAVTVEHCRRAGEAR